MWIAISKGPGPDEPAYDGRLPYCAGCSGRLRLSPRAQESLPHWYPLAGPAGRISHLAAAPNGDLYAVSVTGVNRRDDQTQWRETGNFIQSQALYRSKDGGATWQPATNDLPPGQFTALAVDDVRGDILVGLLGADARPIGVLRFGAAATLASTGRHCPSLRHPQLRTAS